MDNRTLPLPERARNQRRRGIGQLPEQTLRNTDHIGDDKSSDYSRAPPPGGGKYFEWDPLFSFEFLLDLFLASHGREERYLIVACTVITDVPEPVGP